MLECSICSRSFDDRFRVFAPPHPEPFDRIECARRAAVAWGADERKAPILLPTIEALRPHSEPPPALIGRVGIAALALSALVPAQAALAGGAALLTGGTAASVYLAAKPIPGEPASKPTVRVQTPSTAKGTSPQVPAGSLMNDLPAALAWEQPASPKPAPAPRHASRNTVATQWQIAVAQGAEAAQLPARPKPGKLAAPQLPTQSSTGPQAATPMAESRPEPKPKPSQTREPKDTQESTDTPKQEDTPKGKPTDTPKQKDTPNGKPTDTPKQKPPTAKSPSAGPASAPPEPRPTPASPPESHPPTTSEPASNAPSDKPSNSQAQDGSHGNDEGQGNGRGGRGGGR